jgi:hypothetical protein
MGLNISTLPKFAIDPSEASRNPDPYSGGIGWRDGLQSGGNSTFPPVFTYLKEQAHDIAPPPDCVLPHRCSDGQHHFGTATQAEGRPAGQRRERFYALENEFCQVFLLNIEKPDSRSRI